ncbi:hypothetical protein LTR64_002755 [Lithohypha guttulata]|uniref:uncharacterized protein n=1 Tax=Lithohypha guttulata TaxID=1690604 RepID=UPI002DDF0BED|nr:hypothetical protein LTR51_001020 [Lithohypha guttulata]
MNLAEERYYQGSEDFLVDLPDEKLTRSSSSTNIWQYVTAQTAHISWSMLAFDYERAELLSQSCISQLLEQKLSDEHGPAIMLLLATFYSIIGRTQWYQDHFVEARSSYARSLELHQQCLSLYGHGCLDISEVYRFSVLLEYLDSILLPNSSSPGTDHARFRQRLEDELDLTLQTQSDSPLLRSTDRGSVFNKFKASHLDNLVAAGGHGPGAVFKKFEHTIILDGANRRASHEKQRSEQPIHGRRADSGDSAQASQ